MSKAVTIIGTLFLALALAPARLSGQAPYGDGGIDITVLAHEAIVHTAAGERLAPERHVGQVGLALGVPTPLRALRVHGHVLTSTQGQNDLRSLDVGLTLGPFLARALVLEAAFAQRASYAPETGLAHGRVAEFARVGARVRVPLGRSGFALHVLGSSYLATNEPEDADDAVTGWLGESSVSYRVRRFPVTAMLGYRIERFRVFTVEQEVSSLTFSLGVNMLGR
ncbi:MAG TPA: hypothetical protein VFM71_11295 [Gemmatimonadaceae bacterium]|nr:hypothetical protein [Gemmatimonadaceae bacterium]